MAIKWKACLGVDIHKDLKGLVCINHFASKDLRIMPKSTTLHAEAIPIGQNKEKGERIESCEYANDVQDVNICEDINYKAHEENALSGPYGNLEETTKILLNQEIQIKKLDEKVEKLQFELDTKRNELIHMKKNLQNALKVKQNLRDELKNLREQNLSASMAIDQLDSIKQDEILNCLINGIKSNEKYPPSVREFALRLHYNSPAAYKTIRDKFHNHLPHPNTIGVWYRQSDISGKAGLTMESLERLKKIKSEMNGKPLVCSLIFDEIYIRKQVFWNNATKCYEGFVNYGFESTKENEVLPKATQAIVFMLSGLNTYFQFPVAYYFIKGLNGQQRADLLKEVITKVTECGVIISNLTFDGCKANPRMCKLLGGDLNVDSINFRPYIENPVDKSQIYLILDPPHMEKLIRNLLATKKVIFDDENKRIEWTYFVELEKISRKTDLFTHKLNKRHIQWERNKMNVKIAVQTFSRKVADSMEVLMKQKHPKFKNAGPTIRFIRKINDVFDTLNSMDSRKTDIFKRPLNPENEDVVFDLYKECTKYFKSMKINEENATTGIVKKKLIIKSQSCTGVRGFIIDMASMKAMYLKYVKQSEMIKELVAYSFSQDHVELFFAKIRSLHGHNTNPNGMQFKSAYRKLLSNIKILAPESANCKSFGTKLASFSPHTNIYFVSSRRPKLNVSDDLEFQKDSDQHESLLNDYLNLNQMKTNEYLTDELYTSSLAYIARIIEEKIENTNFYCNDCKFVLYENEKIDCYSVGSNRCNPCLSTFQICKIVDRFLNLYQPGCKLNYNFNAIYYQIFQEIDFSKMYSNTCFEHDSSHKYFFIKCIVDSYIQFKTSHIANRNTLDDYPLILRTQLTRLIHYRGQ